MVHTALIEGLQSALNPNCIIRFTVIYGRETLIGQQLIYIRLIYSLSGPTHSLTYQFSMSQELVNDSKNESDSCHPYSSEAAVEVFFDDVNSMLF